MSTPVKTVVINLIGAPGAGKSTVASHLFFLMKSHNFDVELVSEYAKELVWEERSETLKNEIYLFGKQHQRLFRLNGKVKYIVTDRPLILSQFYNSIYGDNSEAFKNIVVQEVRKYTNLNYFLNRTSSYVSKGRNQTEEESNQFSERMKSMLTELKESFTEFESDSNLGFYLLDEIKELEVNDGVR